jgi:hypothetical protein
MRPSRPSGLETLRLSRPRFFYARPGGREPARSRRSPVGLKLIDVEPRPIDRILANWREAQLRLEIAAPGSP